MEANLNQNMGTGLMRQLLGFRPKRLSEQMRSARLVVWYLEESIWRWGHGFLWRCFHTKHHFSSRTTENPNGRRPQQNYWLCWWLCICLVVDRNIPVDATPLKIAAGTDNLANEHLIRRGLTTK